VYPLINSKIISRIARFFAIVSFVFVISLAIITFYLIQIANPATPMDYTVLVIISNIIPYLFIAVLSVVITMVAGNVKTEISNEEALPPVQPKMANG
jgi:hypothetical protein